MAKDLENLVDRFDRILQASENAVVTLINNALQQSFDKLELEIRRKYPTADTGLLAAQSNSIVLLQQIKALMALIDPEQAQRFDAAFQKLIEDASINGQTLALDALRMIDKGSPVFKPQIPIEAVRYVAEDSVMRLQRHGQDFAQKSSAIIAQGLIQNWGMKRTISLMRTQLDVTKSNAETIVRTETMQAQAKAAVATYVDNGVKFGMRVTGTGDRVCGLCAARSGEILPIDKMMVILHPRCRDYLTPVSSGAWVRDGLIDLGWAENFHREVVAALPDKVKPNYNGIAPFEKMAGLTERPMPVWSPKLGFVDAEFQKEATSD